MRRRLVVARTVTQMAAVEQYWTIPQVAERLHSGESTVKRWMSGSRLRPTKAGGRTLVAESDLQAFLKACSVRDEVAG